MGRIPSHIVDQIYQVSDIVEVISEYMPLKKRGANFWALSPFSNEKTPSFAVSPVKGIFKDFSTGKGGNAVTFLMDVEGLTYLEALRYLAKKYGIEIEEDQVSEADYQQEADRRQSLFVVNEFAAKFFHTHMLEKPEGKEIGLAYFKERGVNQASIEAFTLGYAPDQWEEFSQEAIRQQYNPDYLVELGLSSKSEKTGNLIDRFRGRVMFPISNEMGKVLGFGGRILGSRKDIAKYINSPESEIYHKGKVLYGLFQAKKALREKDLCILTEGYLDTVLLHQNGIKHVVASSGTALTPDQCRLIRRFTRNVLMIYDGDAPGVKAALRGLDILMHEGLSARVAVLPDNHDPDSYVRAVGPAAFLDFLEKNGMEGIDFKIKTEKEQLPEGPHAEAKLIKSVAETLANLSDLVERETFVKYAAAKLGVSETLMAAAVGEAYGERLNLDAREKRREASVNPQQAEVKELKGFDQNEFATQERELLRVLINFYDQEIILANGPKEDPQGNLIEYPKVPLADYFLNELEGMPFENGVYEKIKGEILGAFDQQQPFRVHDYLTHGDAGVSSLVSELLTIPYDLSPGWKNFDAFVVDYDHNVYKSVEAPLLHYKRKRVDKLISESQDKIKEASKNSDSESEDQYLRIFMHLLQLRREILDRLGAVGALHTREV